MSKIASNKPMIGLAITTALASVALSGCSTKAAPVASNSFEKAQTALVKGDSDKAVRHAEAAVLAEPRNAGYRSMLGAAYLEAGRFQSAATSFNDAMALGNTDARTVLSYALSETAIGNSAVALATLKEYREAIDPADLGLAYALAGEPARGVHVLSNTLRSGQSSVKVRQNLAYSYALQGNWRAARLMAAEDVPANQINERIAEWAANVGPEAYQTRVAKLLNVKPMQDGGQPMRLALSNFSSQEQMVAEAAASMPAPAPQLAANGELPAIGETAPSLAKAMPAPAKPAPVPAAAAEAAVEKPPVRFAAAFGSPVAKPAAVTRARYVSNAVVQKLPTSYSSAPKKAPRVAEKAPQRRMVSTTATPRVESNGTHLVQLGSFNSRAVAESASKKLQQRYSQLKGRDMVITEARVKGKTYWRVAAAGFAQNSAKSACGSLKAKGQACFAYSASRKLPGAVDRGIRIAAR